ncbi:hypothetical protein [Kitasatospora indigofera]|uniref:hypothetical protein n=1 Tax=Kitasatospora indigofera TaxID=67307 RepID=UPI0033BD9DB1
MPNTSVHDRNSWIAVAVGRYLAGFLGLLLVAVLVLLPFTGPEHDPDGFARPSVKTLVELVRTSCLWIAVPSVLVLVTVSGRAARGAPVRRRTAVLLVAPLLLLLLAGALPVVLLAGALPVVLLAGAHLVYALRIMPGELVTRAPGSSGSSDT